MKEIDSAAFGARVRQRRQELELGQKQLGKESGQSQQNIVTIEAGRMKRPERCALALSKPLCTTPEWLLRKIGPKHIGPKFISSKVLVEKYKKMTPEQKAAVSVMVEGNAEHQKTDITASK